MDKSTLARLSFLSLATGALLAGCGGQSADNNAAPSTDTPSSAPTAAATDAAAPTSAPTTAATAPAATPPAGKAADKGKAKPKGAKASAKTAKSGGKVTKLPDGLIEEDEKVGTGAEAKTGDNVSVNYLGTLTNGKKFDSSYDRNTPFPFTLGAGGVIKGWDEGVVGMKEGGKRKLTIPADLAYGPRSPSPDIPPNSTLVFEIELLKVG